MVNAPLTAWQKLTDRLTPAQILPCSLPPAFEHMLIELQTMPSVRAMSGRTIRERRMVGSGAKPRLGTPSRIRQSLAS